MIVKSIKSKDEEFDWLITAEFEQPAPLWRRILFRQRPRVYTRNFYSKTGIVWHELPSMKRVNLDLEILLEEKASAHAAGQSFLKAKEYIR